MARRHIRAKPGELIAAFGTAERGDRPDIQYAWGGGGASKSDGRILCNALEEVKVFNGKTLREELTDRGYDISTLRFSIKAHPRAAEERRNG